MTEHVTLCLEKPDVFAGEVLESWGKCIEVSTDIPIRKMY